MSIREQIRYRVQEGRLHLLEPSIDNLPHKRFVFATSEVFHALSGPWDDEKTELRMGHLKSDLDVFSEGRLLTASLEPYAKPKSTYMALTDPVTDGVWDIRSRDPKPGMRLLCCFTEPDTLVALSLSDRESLGGPGSKEWRDFIETAKAEWRKHFPSYNPIKGTDIDEFISENVDLV